MYFNQDAFYNPSNDMTRLLDAWPLKPPAKWRIGWRKWRGMALSGGYPQKLWIILCTTCRTGAIYRLLRFSGQLALNLELILILLNIKCLGFQFKALIDHAL